MLSDNLELSSSLQSSLMLSRRRFCSLSMSAHSDRDRLRLLRITWSLAPDNGLKEETDRCLDNPCSL